MATFDYNPITGQLDLVGSGGGTSYIDGVVADSSLLPVTLGTPALDAVYLAKGGSGVWLLNRKPAGLYVRVANDGDADDWTYLGAFPEVNADGNWELYNTADPTKELKFDLASISTGTTRTITVPNANVTLPNQGTSTTDSPEFAGLSVVNTGGDGVQLLVTNDDGVISSIAPLSSEQKSEARTSLGLGPAALGTFAAPPAIGNTTPAAGTFTTLTANTSLAVAGGIITGASNVLEMVNGSNAQTFRLYNTFGFANIFERLSIRAQFSNNFIIATEKGTIGGAARGLEFQTDSVARLTLGSAGGVTLNSGNLTLTDNTGAETATFDAQAKLTANRTYDLPDASGVLALTSNTTRNLYIPASAFIPKTTAGCGVDSRETTTNDQNFDELLFDTGSDEFADALVVMPSNYNNGTVTARFYWTAASGSGGVAWAIQGRAFAEDDALDTAAGTAQLVTDTLIAADDMHVTSATSAVTIGGTPAANTPIQFTIYRDVSDAGDDLAVDARLLGVEILFN